MRVIRTHVVCRKIDQGVVRQAMEVGSPLAKIETLDAEITTKT